MPAPDPNPTALSDRYIGLCPFERRLMDCPDCKWGWPILPAAWPILERIARRHQLDRGWWPPPVCPNCGRPSVHGEVAQWLPTFGTDAEIEELYEIEKAGVTA